MTAEREGGAAAALDTAAACDEARGEVGFALRVRGLCSACRQVLGIPDYERYLAHAAQRHPGAPLLTRGEFCAREFERKYAAGGVRCC